LPLRLSISNLNIDIITSSSPSPPPFLNVCCSIAYNSFERSVIFLRLLFMSIE
jgi:hypothetical protein